MPDLVRLVYVSHPARPLSEAEVDGLLVSARTFNAARAVTGSLLVLSEVGDGKTSAYVQWLEGPEAGVAAAFQRIAGDERHRDIRVLDRSPVPARAYPDWAMRHEAVPGETLGVALARFGVEG